MLWIEAIAPGRFYLRVGLGRKSSGSYYTPHSFVRFLVQETLGPQCDQRSPRDNPDPGAILKLKVLDPACGSGHFLVEACRFLAGRVYEAARLCDELATKAEHDAEAEKNAARKQALLDRAAELRQRLRDLPDQEDELLSYLPSRSAGADKAVLSAHDIARAEAICRRLVAVHCIYGVDLNPLAVELSKLSLWIESHAEGFPLTFLDHRVVVGNSLTGPFWEKLMFAPGSQEPVSDLFRQNLDLKLTDRLREALTLVRYLEASVGVDVEDIAAKEKLKRQIDARLQPFRVLAAAWSGGVMLGQGPGDSRQGAGDSRQGSGDRGQATGSDARRPTPDACPRCDDEAYRQLINHVGNTGELPASTDSPNLQAMIDKGRLALPYDLTFPEVFHPTGLPHGRHGFDAVVGNPPWDAVRPKAKEFFASYDFDILAAPTKRERTAIEKRLKEDRLIATRHDQYLAEIDEQQRAHATLFVQQVVEVNGEKTGGDPDLAKLFLERNVQLLGASAITGLVVPSAFHANEGATGVRRLYLEKMALHCCFSFENRNKLFEIHSSFKFALVVAQKGKATEQFACAFYLHDDQWLFGDRKDRPALNYTLEFVKQTGGEYLSLLELRSEKDAEVARICFANGEPFGQVCERLGIVFGRELHMTDDAWRFTPTAEVLPDGEDPRDPDVARKLFNSGYLVLHEGKSIWQYGEPAEQAPRYLVSINQLIGKARILSNAQYFRLAHREVQNAGNVRTVILNVFEPGVTSGHTVTAELTPNRRQASHTLFLLAIANGHVFDFLMRVRSTAHVTKFLMDNSPTVIQVLDNAMRCFNHSALRLTCNHAGYEPLWREQLGDAWREPGKAPFTWPVLADDDERWAVRAAIDAVVADAYGLSREQYAHVLSTFSHASYKKAPELCLAAFDELKAIGLDAFCKKHDPYHDIPLVETLPKPVIDLPIPEAPEPKPSKGRRRKSADAEPGLYDRVPRVAPKKACPDMAKLAAVKGLLQIRQQLTCADAASQLKYDPNETRTILKYMVSQGLAAVEGKGKGTKYRWAGS